MEDHPERVEKEILGFEGPQLEVGIMMVQVVAFRRGLLDQDKLSNDLRTADSSKLFFLWVTSHTVGLFVVSIFFELLLVELAQFLDEFWLLLCLVFVTGSTCANASVRVVAIKLSISVLVSSIAVWYCCRVSCSIWRD